MNKEMTNDDWFKFYVGDEWMQGSGRMESPERNKKNSTVILEKLIQIRQKQAKKCDVALKSRVKNSLYSTDST